MSKTYELYLHYKQGDDLAGFVEQTETPPGDPFSLGRVYGKQRQDYKGTNHLI